MSLGILYPNGKVEAVIMYVWDIPTLQPVLWDGEVTFSGSISVGSVDQGSAGISPWLVSGPLTDTQLRATPVPVSFAGGGDATAANQTTEIARLTSILAQLDVALSTRASQSTLASILTALASVVVTANDLDIRNLLFATDKVDVSGSSIGVSNFPATQPVSIAAVLHAIIDSGVITSITNPVAVTGPLTDTQLRASVVPVSLDSAVSSIQIEALVDDVAPTYAIGEIQPLSMTADGRLRVSTMPSLVDQIWQGTFNNPWETNFPHTGQTDHSFAGATE